MLVAASWVLSHLFITSFMSCLWELPEVCAYLHVILFHIFTKAGWDFIDMAVSLLKRVYLTGCVSGLMDYVPKMAAESSLN